MYPQDKQAKFKMAANKVEHRAEVGHIHFDFSLIYHPDKNIAILTARI